MDTQELVSKYLPLVKKNWLILAFGALGTIFFAYGLIGLFSANSSSSEEVIFEANSANTKSIDKVGIMVDIEGAVVKPGVYKLSQDSRIQDGLIVAGGLSAQADREYIAKNFNLATKLVDGTKIYIPFIGEADNGGTVLSASSEGISTGNLININTASEVQLDSLPGIGPVTAQKIISGRPYGSTEDLLGKKIVGAKVFDQIKGKIAIY